MINLLADFVVRQTKQEDAFFRCENTYCQEKPNVFVCAVKNADSAVIFYATAVNLPENDKLEQIINSNFFRLRMCNFLSSFEMFLEPGLV